MKVYDVHIYAEQPERLLFEMLEPEDFKSAQHESWIHRTEIHKLE